MTLENGSPPKLPVQQLTILAVARFSEPLALTSVFPYLPEMMESFGVDKDDVAWWAGVTSAVFSLAQSACAVAWGRASDRFGRKPIIVIGLLNALFTFIIWGMATSLPMAIFVRALQGGASGNVGIIRTMVAEMVPEKELQPQAFSLMPLVWSIGSVFGPAFGGFFANPVRQFPGIFGDSVFFKRFPFALPNFVLACFFAISASTAILFLKETLETKRHSRDWGRVLGKRLLHFVGLQKHHHHHHKHQNGDDETGALLYQVNSHASGNYAPGDELKPITPSPPTWREVFLPQTKLTLLCYTFLALHSVSYDQVLQVFLHYPVQVPDETNTSLPFKFSGGFGLNSGRIGAIFAIYGVACGLIQFLLFPPLCHRLGVLNCFKACSLAFPIVYFITPYTALLASQEARFASLMCIMIVKAASVIVGFPCVTILFTNSAPNLRILGTLNGFATSFSGLGRAFGPAATGAAFTWGVGHGYVITPWWLLSFIAALGAVPVWWIVEGDGPRRPNDDSSSSEDGEVTEVDEDAPGGSTHCGLPVVREEVEFEGTGAPLLAKGPSRAANSQIGYSTISPRA